jgi:hypothetical protein
MNRSSRTDGMAAARPLARLVGLAGTVSVLSGVGSWLMVRSQIAEERITVAGADGPLAGRAVRDPVTAFAQAHVIKRAALSATGGRTYGELDAADPNAEMALHAALLRASLFTSILAFGLAAAQVAMGGVLLVIGRALGRLSES